MTQLSVRFARAPWAIAAAALAVVSGVLVAVQPLIAVAAAAVAVVVLAAVFARAWSRAFSVLLIAALVGYLFAGRGFAYLGPMTLSGSERYAPPYIGEFVLIAALVVVLVRFTSAGPTEVAIAALCVLGAARTIPYLGTYGIDALRDAVVWGYAIIALAMAAVATPDAIARVVGLYGRIVVVFLVWYPLQFLIDQLAPGVIPVYAFGVPLVQLKFGDASVHLAGAAGFILVGLYTGRVAHAALWSVWAIGAGIVAAGNRGAMVAIAAALGTIALLRPTSRLVHLIVAGGIVISAALVILPTATPTSSGRSFSADQLVNNVVSLFQDAVPGDLSGTKHYRLTWWGSIIDYTFGGDYFLAGKGFGVNLADDDGFQVTLDGTLRSPHNGHLTFLARMGVPGFAIWIAVMVLLLARLAARVLRARKLGDAWWGGVLTWLAVYLVAMLVNSTFDPYLESPQGGIWFWAVAGFSIAACRAFDSGHRTACEAPSPLPTLRPAREPR